MKNNATRFERKLDAFFWFVVSMLPIILYIVNLYNGGSNDFFAFINDNFTFSFVKTVFDDVFDVAFSSVSPVTGLLSYFVSVEILHIMFDVLVFLPRFAKKMIGRVVE